MISYKVFEKFVLIILNRNVEEMLLAKGEQVKKFTDIDGTLELISEDTKEMLQKLPDSDQDK